MADHGKSDGDQPPRQAPVGEGGPEQAAIGAGDQDPRDPGGQHQTPGPEAVIEDRQAVPPEEDGGVTAQQSGDLSGRSRQAQRSIRRIAGQESAQTDGEGDEDIGTAAVAAACSHDGCKDQKGRAGDTDDDVDFLGGHGRSVALSGRCGKRARQRKPSFWRGRVRDDR